MRKLGRSVMYCSTLVVQAAACRVAEEKGSATTEAIFEARIFRCCSAM